MALDIITWKAVCKKKFFRSSAFKALNAAVTTYLNLGASGLPNLKFISKSKTYQSSDRYSPGCALDDIARLVGSSPATTSPSATTGTTAKKPVIPMSDPTKVQQLIRERDALTPDIRPSGNRYVNQGGKFQPKIFDQEQNYSCTCACATTFLSRLTGKPVDEGAFRHRYNQTTGSSHDFTAGGTLWGPIAETLRAFDADVTVETTSDWGELKRKLDTATGEVPVLFGIQWDNGGSPGGGHAIMCIGTGTIPGWRGGQTGYLIDDPWSAHTTPGLLDITDKGYYWVWDTKTSSSAEGYAVPSWGCVTGKKSKREFGKNLSHTKGIKVM